MRRAVALCLSAVLLLNGVDQAQANAVTATTAIPWEELAHTAAKLIKRRPLATAGVIAGTAKFVEKHPLIAGAVVAGIGILSWNKLHEEEQAKQTQQQQGSGAAAGTPDPDDRNGKPARVIQRGGNTLRNNSAKALNENFDTNLEPREWGRALEELKKDNGIANDDHGVIMSNGDFYNAAGSYVDNLGSYVH